MTRKKKQKENKNLYNQGIICLTVRVCVIENFKKIYKNSQKKKKNENSIKTNKFSILDQKLSTVQK